MARSAHLQGRAIVPFIVRPLTAAVWLISQSRRCEDQQRSSRAAQLSPQAFRRMLMFLPGNLARLNAFRERVCRLSNATLNATGSAKLLALPRSWGSYAISVQAMNLEERVSGRKQGR